MGTYWQPLAEMKVFGMAYGCGEEDWRECDEEVLYDEVSYCMDLVLQHLWVRNSPMKGMALHTV